MTKHGKRILIIFSMCCLAIWNVGAQSVTNKKLLEQTRISVKELEINASKKLTQLSIQKGWVLRRRGLHGGVAYLTGIDSKGYPLYTTTNNNIISAATIGTSRLWPGGDGLNLSGSSSFMNGRLGLWDLGQSRATHVELNGRILQKEPSSTEDHTTHVAGTMIAKGVNPLAKGMAFGVSKLICYDFNDHLSEMLAESPTMLVSNHSYSNIAGWYFNADENHWEFWGDSGDNEDYKFGYYSYDAQIFDSIAYMAPNYLIVKAAGNNRNENGPNVGTPYYRFDNTGAMVNAGLRPASLSSNDSYDNIVTYGVSKNVLTVGAVFPIEQGYQNASDVKATSFSSWGPTDDGRIKPDVVADGINVLSSTAGSDNEYNSFSGTSMASPAVAASAFLLQEYYAKLHNGDFMRSATLKGIIIHTADEAGTSAGPDYQYGWGLMNTAKAAAVITAANNEHLIFERSLKNTGDDSIFVINLEATGSGPITATLSWTDPRGRIETVNKLNNTDSKLVNDLDLRITGNDGVNLPWILNPANPSAAATRGDNTRDNVEKILISSATAGEKYTLKVSHKRSLDRNDQAYSLIVSGAKLSANGGSNNFSLVASPNPSNGRFNVQFLLEEQENVTISLFNTLGQRVYAKSYPGFSGQFSEQIYVPQLLKGLYLLKITHGDKEEVRKLIINKNSK